ncbi:hypothetical protein FOYG_05345 [Fusarium oxysporum NRRL 32931]|uniref:Uncharacterized protein n=1 Tax=Fusarium oxysporum NRRL 32931 TaxID=660029 RepID=W9IVL0_FUSOX|nr:hypothetical protein FOYG_05345 [Fusarium oxysporum NRRL 32931]
MDSQAKVRRNVGQVGDEQCRRLYSQIRRRRKKKRMNLYEGERLS